MNYDVWWSWNFVSSWPCWYPYWPYFLECLTMFNSSMSQRFDKAPLWFTAPGLEVVDGHGDRGWIDQAFFGPRAGRAWLQIKDVRQMEGPHIRNVVEGILHGVQVARLESMFCWSFSEGVTRCHNSRCQLRCSRNVIIWVAGFTCPSQESFTMSLTSRSPFIIGAAICSTHGLPQVQSAGGKGLGGPAGGRRDLSGYLAEKSRTREMSGSKPTAYDPLGI